MVAQGKEGEYGDISASDGSYSIPSLSPGEHTVRIYYGNAQAEIVADVPSGATARIDVVIGPSTPVEVWDYYYDSGLVDLASTKVGTNITAQDTQCTPVR